MTDTIVNEPQTTTDENQAERPCVSSLFKQLMQLGLPGVVLPISYKRISGGSMEPTIIAYFVGR